MLAINPYQIFTNSKSIRMKKNLLLASLFMALSFGMFAQDTVVIAPLWDAFTRGWPNHPDKQHTSAADYSAQGAGRTDLSLFHTLENDATFENRVVTLAFLMDSVPAAIESVMLEFYNTTTADLGDGASLELYSAPYTYTDSVPTWTHLDLGTSYGTLLTSFTLTTGDSLSWVSVTGEDLKNEVATLKGEGKPLCLVLKYNDDVDGSTTIKMHSSVNDSGNSPVLKVVKSTVSVNPQNVRTISVYPNPVADAIHFSEEIVNFQLYSITGALVKETNYRTSQVNVSDVQSGLYIARFKSVDGVMMTERINKQ